MPRFCLRALQGQPLQLHGNGRQQRSFLHVDDVAVALETVLNHGQAGVSHEV